MSSTDGPNRTELKGYNKTFNKNKKQVKTYFKHYLEIEDNEGKPIRVNEKFRENHKNMDVPYKKVVEINDVIYNHSKQKQRNRNLYDKFSNKKNDWD